MHRNRKMIVEAAIAHEETRVCPYRLDYEDDVGERLDAHFGGDAWRRKCRNYIVTAADLPDGITWDQPGTCTDLCGSVWRTDMRPAHLERPVLKTASLQGYDWFDPESVLPDDWEKNARQEIARHADRFVVGRLHAGVFERSWMMRGFVEFLTDVAAEPAFVEDLVAAVADHQARMLDLLLPLPLDGIMFSDDWGDQRGVIIGPERWREVIKPNVARLYAKAKAAGKIVLTHCCGSVVDIMPDMIEIGLDVLQSIQAEARGMNPYELKAQLGDRLTFWGGLGSQSIIPFGTPQELRAEIHKLAREMGKGGGYVLGPAKSLLPETPTKNAAAIVETFLEVGEIDE